MNVKNAVFMEVESQVIRTNSYIELGVIHIAMKINTEKTVGPVQSLAPLHMKCLFFEKL